MTLVLGIESSCDESSVAILKRHHAESVEILSQVTRSQISTHNSYGGVIPEVAAREHAYYLPRVFDEAVAQAAISLTDLDLIAVTQGPGLVGGLRLGIEFAKGLSSGLNKPLYGINHLEGHALSISLEQPVSFPYLLLLVSGGHCQLIFIKSLGCYELLGTTVDDTAGEAFDKVAKMLNLPYPGGPAIEASALQGRPDAFKLPRPMLHSGDAQFSFSGLKTAVRRCIQEINKHALTESQRERVRADLCASFQSAVAETLVKKSLFVHKSLQKRPELSEKEEKIPLVLAGGVAANHFLRQSLKQAFYNKASVLSNPLWLCGDNAAMIAWSALLRYEAGDKPMQNLHLEPKPRWPLCSLPSFDH